MESRRLGTKVALGSAAGAAGTALIQGMLGATKRWMPETLPPLKQDPGKFMVEQAERILPPHIQKKISLAAEKSAARALAFGYGMTFAAGYAALPRRARNIWLDGALLGLASWAAGYLGWLPATKLMPPVWKQKPKQVLPNVLSHLLFGIATVAALNCAEKKLR